MTQGRDVTHQWHALHVAGMAVALVIHLLPRRWRFRAALLLAHAGEPFFRATEAYRRQRWTKIDGPAEIALHMVTNALTVNGTLFDPAVSIDGYEDFKRVCREGRGVLLVQPHAVLTHLQFRIFHDDGLDPIGVNVDARMRIAGTKIAADPILPSPSFLVTARSRLREGRLVCAMLDRAAHAPGRTLELETANGPVIIAPALLQVATRCGARIAFTEVHVERGRVVGRIVMASSDAADEVIREFGEFVRAHIAARFGGTSPTATITAGVEAEQ